MKIALLGYGKMGKEIETIVRERGHEITLRINSANREKLSIGGLKGSDIAIEFSRPEQAVPNIQLCLQANIPVVVGTTGWHKDFDKVRNECERLNGAVLYATNFSIGVNIFFELNRKLAKVMNAYPQYDPHITEVHHTQKLDAPSGTAITLANGIITEISGKNSWVNHRNGKPDELEIISERTENVPGTHEICYRSGIDDISIKHTAHNRKGFALGAVIAAEWLAGKKGLFTMSDVLNVNFS